MWTVLITIDFCYSHDDLTLYAYYNLTFNMIGATMAYYNLTFNVIGATMGGPSQNPLASLYKPRVCDNKAELLRWNLRSLWLALACRGGGLADSRLTSPQDPSALLSEVPLLLSFCGAPPACCKYVFNLSLTLYWSGLLFL